MSYYDVHNATLTLLDLLKYDAIQNPDGVIYKDTGKYVQMLVPMDNSKEHDTYEVYFDDSGRVEKIVGHSTNSGFSGVKYV